MGEAKITDFTPDSRNANRGTQRGLAALDNSLRQYGAGRSIVVDKNGHVIAGNKTLERAADMGLNDVIVVETDGTKLVAVKRIDLDLDTDERARLLAYADNRIGELDLDFDGLQIAADIEAGLDLDGLWDAGELAEILEAAGAELDGGGDTEPQVDKAAELAEKWGTHLGQVWQLGRHRVACGDCTDKAVVEAVMQGEKADLGVTSPPYAVGKEYEINISFDDHLALLRGVADRALDTIKTGGFFFTNFGEIAAQSHSKPLTGSDRQCLYPISKDYWQIFHVERGMDLYAQRVWYKPFNRLRQPFWTYHTSIPHHQEWEHIWTWRLPGGNGDEVYDWDISSRAIWDTRQESTDDKPLTRHVAAFPVCLPERAIKAHSPRGAIVWEPFLGSGTTLIAAHNLNRLCRGVEMDPGYVAVTLQRFFDHSGILPELVSGS